VIGPPGRQDVAVSSVWTTESDPQCCPARSYRFVVAKGTGRQGGDYYRVITDDRPWLGAIITEQPRQSPDFRAVVVSVVPGSPAAGLLRPGDVLTAINGSPALGHGLVPAIFDQLAVYKPGQTVSLDLIRQGNLITLRITFGSLADRRAVNAGANLASSNDTNPQYML
jgi:predicted metalloprotease with PDZ domain